MQLSVVELSELIRRRRSVYPEAYNDRPIKREVIEQVLENARWAPTHKLTQPWRFRVLTGPALERLSEYLGDYYRRHTPESSFSEKKLERTMQRPLKARCVIAICMQRDPQQRVAEWEELAAVACAVQNMWLTCSAMGIGCYWSTPAAALHGNDFFGLQPGERCLGLFYMGYTSAMPPPPPREPLDLLTHWINQ